MTSQRQSHDHQHQFHKLSKLSQRFLVATQAAALNVRRTTNTDDRTAALSVVKTLHGYLKRVRGLMNRIVLNEDIRADFDALMNDVKTFSNGSPASLYFELSVDGIDPSSLKKKERNTFQLVSSVKKDEIATGFYSDEKIFSIINEVDKQVKSLVDDDFDPPHQTPRIIFTGAQSSGKSVVAQRFLSLGVFPSRRGTATLYPREVRLRSLPKSSPITISAEHVRGVNLSHELKHSKDLSAKLSEMVQQAQDKLGRQIMKEPLIITVSSPSVSMDIDVVDLPGYLCNASTTEEQFRVNTLQNILQTYIQSNVEHSLFVVVQEPQEDQLYPFLGFLSRIEFDLNCNLNKVYALTKPDASADNYIRAKYTYNNFRNQGQSVWALRNPGARRTDGLAMKISYREAQCIEDDWFYSASRGEVFAGNDDDFTSGDSRSWNPENWGMISLREHILTRFQDLTNQHFTSLMNHALDTLDQFTQRIVELRWVSSPEVWRKYVLIHLQRSLASSLPGTIDSILQSINVNQNVAGIVSAFQQISVDQHQEQTLYSVVVRNMNSYERWNQLSMDQELFESGLQDALRQRLQEHLKGEVEGMLSNQHLEKGGAPRSCLTVLAREKIAHVNSVIVDNMNAFVESIIDIQFVEEAVEVKREIAKKYVNLQQKQQALQELIANITEYVQD